MLLHAARCALKSSASFDWSKAAASGMGASLFLALPLFVSPACANPAAGAVATGSASIATSSTNKTQIDQTSEDVVIDWSSFNVGAGQTTQFVQPNAQAIAVNRIGGNTPSQILGTLDANGRIVLINGNGMLFGKGSQVNVGSLIATSTGGSDANLLAGDGYAGTIAESCSTGTVRGGADSYIGGLVGYDLSPGDITDSYWDTTTSGITNLRRGAGNVANDTGITGLTTAQFQSGLPTGFSASVWGESGTIDGGLPYLLALPPS